MIAQPLHLQTADYPPVTHAHAREIRRDEGRAPRRIQRLIQSQPAVAIAGAVVVGVAIGWLVKRKQW